MILGGGSKRRALELAFLWLVVVFLTQGLNALSGVARLSGPLRGCQAVASFNNTVAANRTTDRNGSFDASAGQNPDDVVRVAISPGGSCLDVFTDLTLPFLLDAALPANATAGSVGYASFMGLLHLEIAANTTAPNNTSSWALNNITTVRQAMADLYGTFNISLASFPRLDPLQLQPLSLLQSANATTSRALGVALLAADVQMGALTALGAALLNASTAANTAINGTAAANGAAVANLTVLARAVAAEGAQQLLQLEAARQALLAEAAVNATVVDNSAAEGTDAMPPPSPPPPSPPPSAAAADGLYSADVVASVLAAAARRVNVTVPPHAVNATAAVVAGMAAYAEVVKDVALLEMGGVSAGLNPLNALISLTRLAAVQADAAAQMPALVGPTPHALNNYVLDALPERLSKAAVNVTAIHLTLGLTPPPPAVAASGAAHVVGPLSGCMGQANGVWDPAFEAFTTGSATGGLALSAKGTGSVTVTPYRYCQDVLTGLQLSMAVSNLGPALAAVSVSPVAMLAQGFYTLQASQQLTTISAAQQTAAFAAMGLNLTAYSDLMIVPPSSLNSTSSTASASNSTPASPPPSSSSTVNTTTDTATNATNATEGTVTTTTDDGNTTSALALAANNNHNNATAMSARATFNLSRPLMGAVMAANVQLVGLMYASRALFATSCYYAYDMDSMESANTFTVTLTLYATAAQAVNAGGVLNLANPAQLQSIFTFVAKACYFNSTQRLPKNASALPPGATSGGSTGTFLSGGSAAALGATVHSGGDRRRRNALAAAPTTASAAAAAAGAAGIFARSPRPFLRDSLIHRRLRAQLFTAGVTGPETLLWQRRLLDPDPDPDLGPDWDPDPGRPGPYADGEAAWAGGGGRGGGGAAGRWGEGADGPGFGQEAQEEEAAAAAAAESGGGGGARVAHRGLAVYVDDPDIFRVYSKVSEVLSGINSKLQTVQALSNAAAAAGAAAAATTFNLTELVATAAELGYVVQQSLYTELSNALGPSYSSGLNLMVAVQSVAARFTGAALLQRMAEAPVNRVLICSAQGAQCAAPPPPAPAPSGGGGGAKKSNAALYAGVGVGLGLGLVALLLGVWAVRRAVRNREVKQAVVDNFKAGDHMTNMALRLPSALPPEGSKGLDPNCSMIPAALGSNPTVALDYPLYPVPTINGVPSAAAHFQDHTRKTTADGKNTTTTTSAAVSGGAAPTLSLQPTRFPPPAERGTRHLNRPSISVPIPRPVQLPPFQQPQTYPWPHPQQTASTGLHTMRSVPGGGGGGTGGVKTYANKAYVSADGGGGGLSDAAAQRDNLNATGGAVAKSMSYRRPLGFTHSQPLQQQQQQHTEVTGLAIQQSAVGGRPPPPPRQPNASGGAAAAPQRGPALPGLYSAGDSVGLGAAALLNGTLSGVGRRGGLPPLASYTSVTNSAAPLAALNSSLRAIPVNTNFNSSLRPPASHGSVKPPER